MRNARVAAGAAFVLAITGGLPLMASAHADSSILYVDNAHTCSDVAPDAGSQQDPFCHIAAAAEVVQPGQTVQMEAGSYTEETVTLTRSGTPSAPITFTGPDWHNGSPQVRLLKRLVLTGVHDVTVKNLYTEGSTDDQGMWQPTALVQNSSRVTLDHIDVQTFDNGNGNIPLIKVTGQSADVTISRSIANSPGRGDSVEVDPGVTHTVVTTNRLYSDGGNGIVATDAPGTVVTSNTIADTCGPEVQLAGSSTGSTVENNVLTAGNGIEGILCGASSTLIDLSVSSGSAAGTVADYNVVSPKSPAPYSWSGKPYADVAAFRAATGQGAHDLSWTNPNQDGSVPEGAAVIDSADANAPGELSTDLNGHPRVDDPFATNTGTGVGYYDRGAFELQDPLRAGVSVQAKQTVADPYGASLNAVVTSPWSPATTTLDFGDGSTPVSNPVFPLAHDYPGSGNYTVTLTATDGQGTTRTATSYASIPYIPSIQPNLTVTPYQPATGSPDLPLRVVAGADGAAGSFYPVTKDTLDFGDGTVVDVSAASTSYTHDYKAPGTYTVTHTITDDHGRTGTTSRTVTVGSEYVPEASPTRILDTRTGLGAAATPVGPGGVVKLQVTGRAGVPTDGKVTAVLLNLTATDATDATHITAYPGGTVPTASNLNVTPGHDVGNAVLVPVASDGTVSLYNHSGNVDLVADVQGYYTTQPQGPSLRLGTLPQAVRALDTRNGTGGVNGPVGPGGTIKFQVRGPGQLPADAQAAVLNLTATDGTDATYVTAAPNGTPPTNSSLNVGPGQTVANQVTVPINPDGTVTLYNHTGNISLIADLQGYYSPTTGAPVLTVAPTRLVDTRVTRQTLGAGGSVVVKATGLPGMPDHVSAVLVNLTATNPTDASWLRVSRLDSPSQSTSTLNVTPGATVPNLALVPVSPDGTIEVYNHTGSTDVIVDLQGYLP